MLKKLLEVHGLDQTKAIAVDDISAVIKDGDNRTFIDMKTPLAGMAGNMSRVIVDEPYEKVLSSLKALGVTVATLS